MNTAALRITFGAELNASARVMVLAYAELIAMIDQKLDWPPEMDFTLYGSARLGLAQRVGELGRDHAFELVLLGREIEREGLKYAALIRDLRARHRWELETIPDRFVAARALADRIDAFVEKLLCDVPAGEPPASSAVPVSIVNEASDVSHATARQTTGANGLPSIDVLITKLDSALGKRIRSGQGATHGAISSRFGVRPKPGGDDVPA
jgi:hypothetical protein